MEHERDWMVRILGPITVEYRGQDTGNKLALHSRALLVYLAGTAMIGAPPLERNTLQELLWPDPNRGQDPVTLLRVRLSQLRKAFQHGETSPDDILFCAGDTRTVELILSTVEIDAQRFQQLFAKSTHASAELERAKLLREATTLYRGDFGGTWPFDSGLSTDAHLLRVQASLKLTYYDALYQLVKLGVALNDHEQARRDFQTLQTLWVSIENDPQLFDTSADRMEELSEIFSDVEHQPTAASGRTSEPAERLMPKRHLPSAHHQRAAAPDTPRNRRQEQSPADQQSRDDSAPVPISATSLVGHDLTPFIGRAAELDRLLTDFERPFRSRASYWGVTNRRARLITLYGLTGAGKTRIAKEIIHRLSSEASLITRFISLADVSDTEQLLPRIAAALGLNQGGEVFLQVAYKLQAASYLLVLDSLERLMPACNQTIVHLLEQCPSLLCLVTSQRMMGIPQENAIPLHPMAVPQLGEPLEQVVRYDSIRLFVERARARESTFEITKDNVDSIVRLVQSLSGLPLAIKIAAMRINVRTPAEMLKQVQRIEWLTLTTPAEDPRHASLLGAFQWTYDLLPPKLRSCFLALAYFRGGWTPKAAAAIWRVSEVEADRHTEGLLQFALVIKADIQETSIRYTMPDALRLFTESVERHADALESIAERHSAYYQTFVRSQILGGPSPSSRQQIDVEHENIMRVLAYLAQNPADLEAEVQFGITLFDYWNHCNHWGEWRRWMERVLPQRAGLSNPTRRSLLCGAGVLERLHSNYDAAISYYEEAADIPSDNVDQTLRLWERLGEIHRVQGNTEKARELLETCLTIYRADNNRPEVARTLDILAWVACDSGNADLGLQYASESLQMWRNLGEADHQDEIASLYNSLGYIEMLRGDTRAARRYYNDCLAIRDAIGYHIDIAWTKNNLIPIAIAERNFAQARTFFSDSMRIFWGLGQVMGLAWGFTRGAQLELALNRVPQAVTLLAIAEQTYRQYKLHQPFTERNGHATARDHTSLHLSAEDFADAWHRGTHMSLNDAVAFALANPTGEQPPPIMPL